MPVSFETYLKDLSLNRRRQYDDDRLLLISQFFKSMLLLIFVLCGMRAESNCAVIYPTLTFHLIFLPSVPACCQTILFTFFPCLSLSLLGIFFMYECWSTLAILCWDSRFHTQQSMEFLFIRKE